VAVAFPATDTDVLGNVIAVASVPASVRELLTVKVFEFASVSVQLVQLVIVIPSIVPGSTTAASRETTGVLVPVATSI
jgi:hypothetical protein